MSIKLYRVCVTVGRNARSVAKNGLHMVEVQIDSFMSIFYKLLLNGLTCELLRF